MWTIGGAGTIFQCGPGSRDQGFLLGGAQAAVSWPSADCIKASSSTDAVDHNTHNMLLKFSRQELNHQALHCLKGGPRLINIKCCFSKHCTLAHLRSVHWVAKVASVCICVCVRIFVFMCVHVCVHITNYCRVRAVYGPGGSIVCVWPLMSTYSSPVSYMVRNRTKPI